MAKHTQKPAAKPVPLTNAERQARRAERYRKMKRALATIRISDNPAEMRSIADDALKGIAE